MFANAMMCPTGGRAGMPDKGNAYTRRCSIYLVGWAPHHSRYPHLPSHLTTRRVTSLPSPFPPSSRCCRHRCRCRHGRRYLHGRRLRIVSYGVQRLRPKPLPCYRTGAYLFRCQAEGCVVVVCCRTVEAICGALLEVGLLLVGSG